MAKENLTGYTETDPSGSLTITADKVDASSVYRDENAYLYSDKGAGHFDALDVDFEMYYNSGSQDNAVGGMSITNTLGGLSGFAATDIMAMFSRSGVNVRIYLTRGDYVATDNYICAVDTLFYCTLRRAAGNDNVYLDIYSDSGRTNLLDTLTIAGVGTATYRYIQAFNQYVGAQHDYYFTGYFQNFDLNEAAPPVTAHRFFSMF